MGTANGPSGTVRDVVAERSSGWAAPGGPPRVAGAVINQLATMSGESDHRELGGHPTQAHQAAGQLDLTHVP
jgi:hypothetical protein